MHGEGGTGIGLELGEDLRLVDHRESWDPARCVPRCQILPMPGTGKVAFDRAEGDAEDVGDLLPWRAAFDGRDDALAEID
jgi:hypothetical protein